MPSLFRDPLVVTYVDEDNATLAVTEHADVLPRVGENVRINSVPHVVEHVGYDLPGKTITAVWVVCRRV